MSKSINKNKLITLNRIDGFVDGVAVKRVGNYSFDYCKEHLDDLMLRRTRLGMCLPNGGSTLFPALKELFLSNHSWDDERWQKEVTRYEKIWRQYYSLPSNT